MSYRIARDSLGEVRLPADAYYGAQTQRAVENFPISGLRLPRRFIRAQGIVKAAAATANMQVGALDARLGRAIVQAAEEVIQGQWDHQFVVDVYQAGAGTSQNMNANEVIASRAAEILGGSKGDYHLVHPNNHVNMAQSTNDTIHTAMNISAAEAVQEELLPALKELEEALQQKAQQFHGVLKAGRTHLQDAVPMRLGQEFRGYAAAISRAREAVQEACQELYPIPLGGNAVGTGINAHPDYPRLAVAEVARRTGLPFAEPAERFMLMQNPYGPLRLSSSLKDLSVHLIKISSDLRLLSSGPRTGLAEITLPAVQPGSSIMPGKVNPVMAEMLYMVAAQVIGCGAAMTVCGVGSQLELNVMMPVMAYNLLHAVGILSNAIRVFVRRCVQGIEANEEMCAFWLERSLSVVTALNPVLGYDRAAELAREAHATGKTIRELLREKQLLPEEQLAEVLDLERMAGK